MMREIPNVRQISGDPMRRWFCDDFFDLIVWYDGNHICGFQLCYDRFRKPRALTWTEDEGFSHHAIDDGDDPMLPFKATPILIQDGLFDNRLILERFTQVNSDIPSSVTSIVKQKIADFGEFSPSRI